MTTTVRAAISGTKYLRKLL